MLVAIPEWNGRISPVFEEAHYFKLFRIEDGQLTDRTEIRIEDINPDHKLKALLQAGVNLIICGAITNYSQRLAEVNGLQVIGFIAGSVEQVLIAWMSGNWQQDLHCMPGCGRRRRQRGSKSGCQQRGRGGRQNRFNKNPGR